MSNTSGKQLPAFVEDDELPDVTVIDVTSAGAPKEKREYGILRRLGATGRFTRRWAIRLLVLALLLAYPLTAVFMSRIDDSAAYVATDKVWADEQVGVAVSLLRREVEDNGWAPGAPAWHPRARLNAMPSFQTGIGEAIADYAVLLASSSIESGTTDSDLATAARLLKTPGDSDTDDRLVAVIEAFVRYDGRVARNVVNAPPPGLQLVNEMALYQLWADQGRARLAAEIRNTRNLPVASPSLTRAFYRTKGEAYAAYQLLLAVREKHGPFIDDLGAKPQLERAIEDWRRAARLQPLLVSSGRGDSLLLDNHLMTLAYLIDDAGRSSEELGAQISRSVALSADMAEPVTLPVEPGLSDPA